MVGCRVDVDSGVLQVTWGGRTVATHHLVDSPHDDVWDPAHRGAAEAAALGRTSVPRPLVNGPLVPRPARSFAEYDVDAPDLSARYGAVGEMV
jgi:hypothetical protein